MRIGCDIDGVLANFNLAFGKLANSRGHKLPMFEGDSHPPTWYWAQHYGLSNADDKKLWDWIAANPSWQETFDALPDGPAGIGILDTLQSKGHDVTFITARPGAGVRQHTITWLERHGMTRPQVIVAQKKVMLCAELGLDVMIEDHPDTIKELQEFRDIFYNNPNRIDPFKKKALLSDIVGLRRPYNKETQDLCTKVRWVNNIVEAVRPLLDKQSSVAA